MRDTNMMDPEALPPYEPIISTPTPKPLIVALKQCTQVGTTGDHYVLGDKPVVTNYDALNVYHNTEYSALTQTLFCRTERKFEMKNGLKTESSVYWIDLVLSDGRHVNIEHEDTWQACRTILLTQDTAELVFEFILPDGRHTQSVAD
ncbi:hypothetical protein B0A55_00939 [Friedmanniomyces simplex]|uniref:Uncharacterized protein n=1 Tax=Friedmanniomyces simplex TaxID=329884 RepID=A0A4U0Y4F5_9PEZI|nr:hypothetical protein B0A55_00939 [Friedmanniomyces simplex]